VNDFGWLTERQFLDAVAVADDQHAGPVVITVAFIGYLVAGPAGPRSRPSACSCRAISSSSSAATYFRRAVADPRVRAFVTGVTAAGTGAIAGAAVVLGRRAIVDRADRRDRARDARDPRLRPAPSGALVIVIAASGRLVWSGLAR